jgi:threonine synthase
MPSHYHLVCPHCGSKAADDEVSFKCQDCGGVLEHSFDVDYLRSVRFSGPLTFWRYKPVMPKVERPVSLGEGGTPLFEAKRLGENLGFGNVVLKDETRNPTNSFKDRSASLIVSDAVGKGFDSVVCATNGNHGASLAAYSAKEDIACHLIVPSDLDIGKLAQMIAYDAAVDEASANIEEAIGMAVSLEERTGWYQATTELNPLSIEALKTISYEISEQGDVPDWVVVAMGSGVTIHSIWKGFKELEDSGRIEEKPRLIGVQATGCSPITRAFRLGESEPVKLEAASTVAMAIKVSRPFYGVAALKDIEESDGLSVSVTDDDMLNFEKEIARTEGIFVEPASAATVACLPELLKTGLINSSDSVLSIITSSGLKTNDIISSLSRRRRSLGLGSKLATKERLLKTISRKRTYGYALWKGLGREMTLGAVYQHISDLEGRGLLASHVEGKRRYLEITEKGWRVLAALDELRELI